MKTDKRRQKNKYWDYFKLRNRKKRKKNIYQLIENKHIMQHMQHMLQKIKCFLQFNENVQGVLKNSGYSTFYSGEKKRSFLIGITREYEK